MTSSETRLHSGEGVVGFEMVGDLFVNLAFEDLEKASLCFPNCLCILVLNFPKKFAGAIRC